MSTNIKSAMIKKLNWKAVSGRNRIEIIEKVKSAISSNDGYIINFNMFSDLALSLSIEIPANRIVDLHNSLATVLTISEIDSNTKIQQSNEEWLIYINLSFGAGKGDLVVEVPAVPG